MSIQTHEYDALRETIAATYEPGKPSTITLLDAIYNYALQDYESGLGAGTALSLSFGLIFTPSNLAFDLFCGFEVAADGSGGEVSADEVLSLSRSEEGGSSFCAFVEVAVGLDPRVSELCFDCGSAGPLWGLGGREGWRGAFCGVVASDLSN